MTTIFNTVRDAANNPVAGAVVEVDLLTGIRPGSLGFDGTEHATIVSTAEGTTDNDGYYEFELVPNATISPAGSVYRISEPGGGWRRYAIVVPASGGPYWTGAILAVTQPAGPLVRVAAENVSYDHTTSGLTADDAQAALDELAARPVVADAADVTFDHSGTDLTSINVQAALVELDEKVGAGGSLGDPVVVAHGGTGASTAAAARTNLGVDAAGTAAGLVATEATARTAGDTSTLTTAEGYTDTKVAAEASARATADALLIPLTQKGANSGVATLDSGGHVPQAQIPSIALVAFLGAVASQAAMLALSGQAGDWCTRTDTSTTWQLTGTDPTQLSNWTQFLTPASPVVSVNGRTGGVTGLAEASDLTAEAATRASGDSTNATAITAEATTRAAADATLTAAVATKLQGLTRSSVKTTGYTAVNGDLIPVDTTSAPVTITLPTAAAGAVIAIKHIIQGSTNAVTYQCAGSDVFNKSGGGTTGTLPLLAQGVILLGAAGIWTIVADDLALAQLDLRYVALSNVDTDSTFAANSDTKIASQKAVKTAFAPLLALQKLLAGLTTQLGAFDRWRAGVGLPGTRTTGSVSVNATSMGIVDAGIATTAIPRLIAIDDEIRFASSGLATTTVGLDANLVGLCGTTNATHASGAPVLMRRERHVVFLGDSIIEGMNTGADPFVDRTMRVLAQSLGGMCAEEWPLWREAALGNSASEWLLAGTYAPVLATTAGSLCIEGIVQFTGGTGNLATWTRPARLRVQGIDVRWIDEGTTSAGWSYSLDGGSTWVDNPVASVFATRSYTLQVTRIRCDDPASIIIRAASAAGTSKGFALPFIPLTTWSSYPTFGRTGGIAYHNLGYDGAKLRQLLNARTVADVTTDGTGALVSATAAFVAGDVASTIMCNGVTTTLASRASGTNATATANIPAGTNQTLTIFQGDHTSDWLRIFDGDPGSIVPDLLVLWSSPNDMAGTTSLGDTNPDAVGNMMQYIINRVGGYCDVLILSGYEYGSISTTLQAAYRAKVAAVAAANGCQFLDLYQAFALQGLTGYTAMNAAGYMADAAHLAAKGQRFVGEELRRVFQET